MKRYNIFGGGPEEHPKGEWIRFDEARESMREYKVLMDKLREHLRPELTQDEFKMAADILAAGMTYTPQFDIAESMRLSERLLGVPFPERVL